jgi:microcompartment protein CcmK/EutM
VLVVVGAAPPGNLGQKAAPVDAAIVGIIDSVDIQE